MGKHQLLKTCLWDWPLRMPQGQVVGFLPETQGWLLARMPLRWHTGCPGLTHPQDNPGGSWGMSGGIGPAYLQKLLFQSSIGC